MNLPFKHARFGVLLLALAGAPAFAQTPHVCPAGNPDEPTWVEDIEQADIVAGKYNGSGSGGDSPDGEIFTLGGRLAEARFNSCDGQGRPASKGGHPNDGVSQKRAPTQPSMTRLSGPEGSSCFGCHSQPRAGGSGDFVANTFNGAEDMDPVTYSFAPNLVNERNTPGMFGAGYIEIAALEMSKDLQTQAQSLTAAHANGWQSLTSKGVTFQVYFSNGTITDARGVDTDLIVKPFGAGGTVVSLRQFSVQAMNRHHGMQAEETYDMYMGDPDFDGDGVTRELTVGDVTMLSLWQAMLSRPIVDRPPPSANGPDQYAEGKKAFEQVGCASCHTETMTINSNIFCEPNPYNPPQIFHDQTQKACVPLVVAEYSQKHADPDHAGDPVTIHAYTDLKRHDLCDPTTLTGAIRNLCNEQNLEGRPNQGSTPGYEYFKTAPLWATYSSAPYGHDGRYPSVFSIINVHGGEARASRDAFLALPVSTQADVVVFLRSLRVKDQRARLNGNS